MRYGNYSNNHLKTRFSGKNSRWKTIVSSHVSLIILAIIVFVIVNATVNIHEKSVTSQQRLRDAEAELQKIKNHAEDVSKEINYLSDDKGIEAELRIKYKAVREGESVAVIIGDDSQLANAVSSSSTKSVVWYKRIFGIFGF